MGPPHGHDPGLDLWGGLMGTPIGPGASVGQGAQTLGGVAHQPAVDRATVDPIADGHAGDPGALERLPHREVTLLNH